MEFEACNRWDPVLAAPASATQDKGATPPPIEAWIAQRVATAIGIDRVVPSDAGFGIE
jgi:hypothetical protein